MSERNGPLPEIPETPAKPALSADLAAVQADDALLDELHGPNPLGLHPEHPGEAANVTPSPENNPDVRLVQVLAAWRDEVDSEPAPQLMDVDTALAIVRAHSHRSLAGRIADAVRRLIGGGR